MSEEVLRNKLVLVTGGSGFVATHVIKTLLEKGARVRTTVRSLKSKVKVDSIKNLSPKNAKNMDIRESDLLDDKPWDSIVEGCDYVLHIASPVGGVSDAEKQIRMAVEGTRNVMLACVKH